MIDSCHYSEGKICIDYCFGPTQPTHLILIIQSHQSCSDVCGPFLSDLLYDELSPHIVNSQDVVFYNYRMVRSAV